LLRVLRQLESLGLAVCNDWEVLCWPFLGSQILKSGGTDFVMLGANAPSVPATNRRELKAVLGLALRPQHQMKSARLPEDQEPRPKLDARFDQMSESGHPFRDE
jgi:hypothetical protein